MILLGGNRPIRGQSGMDRSRLFADRLVGQADDEIRQARGDLHLDLDAARLQAKKATVATWATSWKVARPSNPDGISFVLDGTGHGVERKRSATQRKPTKPAMIGIIA